MNLLNIHYCIRAAGQEMANLFALSYLYKQGMSLAAVCYTYTLFFAVRLVFRPLVVRLCAKKGVHFCLVAGACLFAVRYLTLIGVSGVNFWVFAFLVVSGFTEAFYWAPYHAYFGVIGAKEDRGSNIGVREAFSALISVVAPVCGGFLLNINRILAFSFSSLLILLSIYPLMLAPEIPLPKRLNRQECKACDKTGFRFFFADGIFSQPISVWPLVVFMMLSENYGEFGLILGLAAVFKAAGNMVFGRLIDCGKGLMIVLYRLRTAHSGRAGAHFLRAHNSRRRRMRLFHCNRILFFAFLVHDARLQFCEKIRAPAVLHVLRRKGMGLFGRVHHAGGGDFGAFRTGFALHSVLHNHRGGGANRFGAPLL